ncbi:MAG: DUF4040 domain-containing protein [Alphaproteobacteria bacterium]|nr:DUF4040 domain-containing protein [Alphaproteobacteria bacterium]
MSLPALLTLFALAALAPALTRRLPDGAAWLLACVPAAICALFAVTAAGLAPEQFRIESTPWAPTLGASLSFRLDGLSLAFGMLITGIGALILVYAGGYLHGDAKLGRFLGFLLFFMAAMLGVVLADNILALFVFWELTSLASYLLIGFKNEDGRSRRAALQALIVTGGGGAALLAGLLLFAQIGGSMELSGLIASPVDPATDPLLLAAVVLILLGCFTKSAQVPFHFWLPNAMEAPTPVSAYLHSATMVKAGVYLMARLNPAFGGSDIWTWSLVLFGGATMLAGAVLALRQTDLKLMLAYTTVMALGLLTFLIGIGGKGGLEAMALFLLAHAFYKGGLFMAVGAVDHEAGTRDLRKLGGLLRPMPALAVAVFIIALSSAGLPPFLGFLAKEYAYEAGLGATHLPMAATFAMLLANVCLVAVAGAVSVGIFLGAARPELAHVHEAPIALRLGPSVLALLTLVAGLAPGPLGAFAIAPLVSAMAGRTFAADLHLWAGFTPALGLSVITLMLGYLAYLRLAALRALLARAIAATFTFDDVYDRMYRLKIRSAARLTNALQRGSLGFYLSLVFAALGVAPLAAMLYWGMPEIAPDLGGLRAIDVGALALLATGGLAVGLIQARLTAIVALGLVGFAVALIFLLYGAPDLAFTQFMVETMAVVILALALLRLPLAGGRRRSGLVALRDMVIAGLAGISVSAVLLGVLARPFDPLLSEYFAENSYILAHGRNVVNVILVDFRALDTLGEITVIAIAAIAAYAMIRFRTGTGKEERK